MIKNPKFFIDNKSNVCFASNPILFSGWFFDGNCHAARRIRIRVGNRIIACEPTNRQDVIEHFKDENFAFGDALGFHIQCKTGTGVKLFIFEAETISGDIIKIGWRLYWMLPYDRRQKDIPRNVQAHSKWEPQVFINEALRKQLASRSTFGHGAAITVIIPIYNAAEKLRKCLDSLEKYLDIRHSVILVDDCSTENDVVNLARTFASNRKFVTYVKNNVNLGFIGSCNHAVFDIDTTGNDILLLNSDTELTPGAVEEMQAVLALHDRHIAVCPRSNKATIFSYPRNKSVTAEESYRAWRSTHSALPRWQIMPTAVGFCMLLKRKLIATFGLFDPAYERGYNEENDFMCRANRAGYSSVAANHAYVYHHEGVSFGSEREMLEKKNRELLLQRYPEFGRTDPFWVNLRTSLVERFSVMPSGRKRLLVDFSQLPSIHNGTSTYCIQMLHGLLPCLEKNIDVIILINKSAYQFHKKMFSLCDKILFVNPPESDIYDLIFVPMQIWDINHLACIFTRSPRVIFTLHDIISLRCNYLFEASRWRALHTAIHYSDHIVSISDYTIADARNMFPDMRQSTTIYHGRNPNWHRSESQGNHVLIFGNSYHHKAVLDAVEALRDSSVEIKVVGPSPLNIQESSHIPSGHMDDQLIQDLYSDAKVVVFPSLYEGFGYPAYQASSMGLPVLVYDNPLNRELQQKGYLKNVYFFSTFAEIQTIVAKIIQGKRPCDSSESIGQSIEQMGRQYADILKQIITTPINMDLLNQRMQWMEATTPEF